MLSPLAGVLIALLTGDESEAELRPTAETTGDVEPTPAAVRRVERTSLPQIPTVDPKDSTRSSSRRSIRVSVLNGAQSEGLATRTRRRLRSAGFDAGVAGNAATPVQATEVLHRPGAGREARMVARALHVSTAGRLGSADDAPAGKADVVVIAGPDLVSG